MSKAKAHIRTAHGIRYRHPVPDPFQLDKPDGPWYMRLSIYPGKASKATRVCSSKKGLSWVKKPDPEAATCTTRISGIRGGSAVAAAAAAAASSSGGACPAALTYSGVRRGTSPHFHTGRIEDHLDASVIRNRSSSGKISNFTVHWEQIL